MQRSGERRGHEQQTEERQDNKNVSNSPLKRHSIQYSAHIQEETQTLNHIVDPAVEEGAVQSKVPAKPLLPLTGFDRFTGSSSLRIT
jgi:hypothetical protein